MKTGRLFKKGICTFAACFALFGTAFFGMSDTAAAAEAVNPADILISSEEIGVSPRDSQFVWKYKEENGKLYRRLYDTSTGIYLTDWLYVRDL